MSDFNEKSYELHKKHFEETTGAQLENWKKKDTVDYWRHERSYRLMDALIEAHPEASWLTVGDGRYGTDAHYILGKGLKNVLASDISDTLLIEAKRDGFITDYATENAEKMSFPDGHFDFVLCKEAYHHFPRPAIALYEMLRVAKKGVVLIEPLDKNILYTQDNFFVKCIRSVTNILMLQWKGLYKYENFEEVGNYIYTVSEREINKVALALNLKYTFFKKQNDCFIPGADEEKLADKGPIYQTIKRTLRRHDLLCRIGIMQYGLMGTIIMKEKPDAVCLQKLKEAGYQGYVLPDNPYV